VVNLNCFSNKHLFAPKIKFLALKNVQNGAKSFARQRQAPKC